MHDYMYIVTHVTIFSLELHYLKYIVLLCCQVRCATLYLDSKLNELGTPEEYDMIDTNKQTNPQWSSTPT